MKMNLDKFGLRFGEACQEDYKLQRPMCGEGRRETAEG